MSEQKQNLTIIQQVEKMAINRADDVKQLHNSMNWGPLAGLAGIYLAHIRQVEKEAGTTPNKLRKTNRTMGRGYDW